METFDVNKAIEAQKEYLKELAAKNPNNWMSKNMAKGEGLAPATGYCYRCHRQIYDVGGISVEKARTDLVTGCPFCHVSYVD